MASKRLHTLHMNSKKNLQERTEPTAAGIESDVIRDTHEKEASFNYGICFA